MTFDLLHVCAQNGRGEMTNPGGDEVERVLLTLALVVELGGEDCRLIQKLNASKQRLKGVEDLSKCDRLARLDISHNALRRFKGIARCISLTWLDISHNKLESLDGVQRLVNLSVLRASNNVLTTCPDLSPHSKLKALILSNNELSSLPGLSSLCELNTLVLSHNKFAEIDVSRLKKLTKLSVSHNQLSEVPDTQSNHELGELRLNNNEIKHVRKTLKFNTKLKIIDMGNNKLERISLLRPLSGIGKLVNVNLRGNPLCDDPSYVQQVLRLLSSVVILDGTKRTLEPLVATSSVVKTEIIGSQTGKRKTGRHTTTEEVEERMTEEHPLTKKKRICEEQSDHYIPEVKKRIKVQSTKSTCQAESPTTLKLVEHKQLPTCSSSQQVGLSPGLNESTAMRAGSDRLATTTSHPTTTVPTVETKSSLKSSKKMSRTRGRSGVVAVEEIQRTKRKKARPLSFDDGDYQLVVGRGQSSSWTT